MKEHQVKINQSELLTLALQSVTDLHSSLYQSPASMDANLDRVNYLVKRLSKSFSDKPDIETQTDETKADAAPVAQSANSGWGN